LHYNKETKYGGVNNEKGNLYHRHFVFFGIFVCPRNPRESHGHQYRGARSGFQGKKILGEDVRGAMGMQEFVKSVPLNLVCVSDYSKLARVSDEDKRLYSGAHTGFISQNVYLFCASEGLATVVRGLVDREAMTKTMKLRPEQRITLAQSIGYRRK
jgi:hypothetical protein